MSTEGMIFETEGTITGVEVSNKTIVVEYAMKDEDGDEVVATQGIRLGVWDEVSKSIKADEEAEQVGLTRFNEMFGVPFEEANSLIGQSKHLFITLNNGRVYLEMPTWVIEQLERDKWFEALTPIGDGMVKKTIEATVEKIISSKGGIYVFIRSNSRVQKGNLFMSRFSFADGNGKVTSGKKQSSKTRFKGMFEVNAINEEVLESLVGTQVSAMFNEYNNTPYVELLEMITEEEEA